MKLLNSFGLLVLVVFVAIFPVAIAPNDLVNAIAVFTVISGIAIVGWNIFSGYTGYISLGHSVFFGLGAYTLGIACRDWHIPGGWGPFLLLPLVGLVAGLVALVLGKIVLHVRRHTFIVITIAFVFIFQLMAYNLQKITGGSNGIFMPLTPWDASVADLPFYYVALGFLLIAVVVSWWIRHSKFGLGLLAIRDDEDRALGLGVQTSTFKLAAYVISAVFVSFAGALYTYYVGSVYPEMGFSPAFDITVALAAFSGGLGTVAGPLIGALLIGPLQQELSLQFGGHGVDLMIYGGLFLVVILLLPRGIIPSVQQLWQRWQGLRKTEISSDVHAISRRIPAAPPPMH
jgi:branched-chain amino acid transport system permease protein